MSDAEVNAFLLELAIVAEEHADGILSDAEAKDILAAMRWRIERAQGRPEGPRGHRRPKAVRHGR